MKIQHIQIVNLLITQSQKLSGEAEATPKKLYMQQLGQIWTILGPIYHDAGNCLQILGGMKCPTLY